MHHSPLCSSSPLLHGAGNPMSLKTCCSRPPSTAAWIGTRRPSWPSHALYPRRTSTKTSWVGALRRKEGSWLLVLSNRDSWSTGIQQRCWIKCVYYPNVNQDTFCTYYWQVMRKMDGVLQSSSASKINLRHMGSSFNFSLAYLLCLPFVLWINSHSPDLSIVVILSLPR